MGYNELMANTPADFPAEIHEPIDIDALGSSPLGSTPKSHTDVHGKIENELTEIQRKIGVGASPASTAGAGKVLTTNEDGSSGWADPSSAELPDLTAENVSFDDEFIREITGDTITGDNVQLIVNGLVVGFSGTISSIYEFFSQLEARIGAPNGIASLDGDGKVPLIQLPEITGGSDLTAGFGINIVDDEIINTRNFNYLGTWSAGSNNITYIDGSPSGMLSAYTPKAGDMLRVRTAGNIDIGNGAEAFSVNDLIYWDGSAWKHIFNKDLSNVPNVDATNRANHSGFQLASTISDFDAQVRTNRLDQMAAPTAAVSANSQRITGLLDPTNPQDAATRAYVLAQIALLVNASPGALDTLAELAAALGNDPNFATTVSTQIAAKIDKSLADVNSVLGAITDDTPIAIQIPASSFFGRKASGNIAAMTVAEAKTLLAYVKGDLNLGNVDNTSDMNKPVSTAQQAAINAAIPIIDWTLIDIMQGI